MDKQLLILDLDETLVYGAKDPLAHACDFEVGPYSVYRRPFLTEFLATASQWFTLAVWSSGSSPYVQGVVQHLFPESAALRFVWSRERCTQRLHPEHLDYYWVKNLKKVARLGYPLERVLMIDDTPRKLERQYGNHLRVRPFLGEPDDAELRDVLPFLDWLRGVENLRAVEKRYWRDFVRQRQGEAGTDQ